MTRIISSRIGIVLILCAIATAAPRPLPPPAPAAAAAAGQTCAPPPVGTHCVDLTWTASPTPGVTYNIYRTTTTGACAPANKYATGITGTYYADMTVTNGATYKYALSAQNSGGESTCTAEVQVQIPSPPQPPTNPNAIPQ